MSTYELMNNGFRKANEMRSTEFRNGIVTVKMEPDENASVFITDVKINGVKSIDELMYICKRVNVKG